ncbi:MAG: PEP-CTERM sorting domain-containing protein [Opitutales bacterium]|nr:PEP-CTERM sorting domain-containing protein [Opitutales bacterium]
MVGSSANFTVEVIPEPSTYAALFGLAALGFAFWHRRRR